jgi:hypothetical protein
MSTEGWPGPMAPPPLAFARPGGAKPIKPAKPARPPKGPRRPLGTPPKST